VPPVDAFHALLPVAAIDDLAAYDLRPASVAQTGRRILRLMAAIAGRATPASPSIAEAPQQAWLPDDPQVVTTLNTALILCTDHELNVSAFTARCVASAGSTPYAVVAAGLAALQGTKHGGHTGRVGALLHEVGTPERARPTIADRLRRGETLPGFGQPLYPDGDPRSTALVQLATRMRPGTLEVQLATAVAHDVWKVIGEHPNIDFGLAMLGGEAMRGLDPVLEMGCGGDTIQR
jgi:citrate synthase